MGSLLRNIGAPGHSQRPELTRALRFDQGLIFFSNERKKGYYMIFSQPKRRELNIKSLSEEHTLTWKLLSSGEAPEAAARKFPCVNV